jgi:hypothetical protein
VASGILPETLAWGWLYCKNDSFHTGNDGSSNGISVWRQGNVAPNSYQRAGIPAETVQWGCHMYSGSIKFTISENTYEPSAAPSHHKAGISIKLGDKPYEYMAMSFDPFGKRDVPTPHIKIDLERKYGRDLGTYSLGDTFVISFDSSIASLYKNGQRIWSGTWANKVSPYLFRTVEVFSHAVKAAAIRDLQASPEIIPNTLGGGMAGIKDWYGYPVCLIQVQNTESGSLGFEKLDATANAKGTPPTHVLVSYGNNMSDWTPFVEYKFGNPLSSNYNSLQVLFKDTAGFENNYNLTDVRLWSFLQQNITLGVCNLTNMSVFQALKELAALAMYEMGFDANDKFFFRKRHQTTALKTITDDQIISMDNVQYNMSRLKTRIVVGYGGYTKIVDSDTQQEPHPTNKDKYGERVYEISGSQILPADNVDLAYAVAPTIYSELSKLRLTLSIKTVLDLELELGDYVRILHNNSLFTDKMFADFTDDDKSSDDGKPKCEGSSSAFYMKCKVVGIRTDFNKRTTLLDLIDYTKDSGVQ